MYIITINLPPPFIKKPGLLGLFAKKKVGEIKFIDIQDQDNTTNTNLENENSPSPPPSPIPDVLNNIQAVRFAIQEDDTDLIVSGFEGSSPADVVRQHLLAKVVNAVVQPVIIRGRRDCECAVRIFVLYTNSPF